MGANNSSLTPLNCILKNWDRFDPRGLKKTHLVFLCDTARPRYPLEGGERWQGGGSLKHNAGSQLDRLCRKRVEWGEVSCVSPSSLGPGVTPPAPSCAAPPGETGAGDREVEKRLSPVYPWDHMCAAARDTEEQPHKLLPLHEAPSGRNNQSMRVNKPFSYQEIQTIKEDLGDYLEDPEKYTRAFKGVTLLYDLTRKDVMYILGQTLTSDSKT